MSFCELNATADDDLLIKIDSFDVNIIPPSSGVQFYKDGIVFLSRSTNFSKMVPVHISFGAIQVYYAALQDSILVNPRIFSPAVSFAYPCDALTFSNDFNVMYFTKRGKNDASEKIYQANFSSRGKNSGSWQEAATPLNFCSDNSTYTHPTISTDGSMLIFASNKTGSLGGMDLFITRKRGEQWSTPENLGNLINTKSNELYPSLDSANNLFFSSDGHPGYGGYDIFVCRFTGKGWEEPYNLTKLVNSENDDVAFNLNRQNGRLGFFTSTGKTKESSPQLYKVTYNFKPAPKIPVSLSTAIQTMAFSDMTFPHRKLIAEVLPPEVKKEVAKPPEVIKEVIKPPEVKKEEIKPPEVKKEEVKPPEVKKEPVKPRVDTIRSITPVREELKDVVVYRIQIKSSPKQLNLKQVVINGKTYTTYTYFYLNEYRYTIGEFTVLAPARELQFSTRKSGYPQAFVAAFKNNLRTLDLTLFTKREDVKPPEVEKPEVTTEINKEEIRPPEVKKEEIKPAEPISEVVRPPAEVKKEDTPAPVAESTEAKAKVETVKLITPLRPELQNIVVYRVQFLSSSKQQTPKQVVVNGKHYSPFIYYYLNLYRYTVGEFTSLELAKEFQSDLRKAGHPQAFIVAFKNSIRSLDLSTFK